MISTNCSLSLKDIVGVGEIAQWLRIPEAVPEDMSSVLTTQVGQLQGDLKPFSGLCG